MNTFSDLLATDPTVSLRVRVQPVYGSRPPDIEIRLDRHVICQGPLDQVWYFEQEIGLLDPLTFEIELRHKIYDPQDETAAVVEQLDLDDFSLIPKWTHVFQYDNDHDFRGPTAHVGFVGTWRLVIDEPIYRWRHRIIGQGWLLAP